MTATDRYFTFGQSHTANIILPRGGRLADYWVTVVAEKDHRKLLIDKFTSVFCPSPHQFAFEYNITNFLPEYCSKGELERIYSR